MPAVRNRLGNRARPCDGRGRAFESPQPCHPFGVRLTGRTQDFESWGPGSNPGRRASDAALVQLAGREILTLEIVVRIHGAVPTRLVGQSSNGRMAVSKTADRGSNPCWPANPQTTPCPNRSGARLQPSSCGFESRRRVHIAPSSSAVERRVYTPLAPDKRQVARSNRAWGTMRIALGAPRETCPERRETCTEPRETCPRAPSKRARGASVSVAQSEPEHRASTPGVAGSSPAGDATTAV